MYFSSNRTHKLHKPRLLIAGGSHSEIPLIKASQNLGYHTISSGNVEKDLGHLYSDEVHLADYSNKTAMLDLASNLSVDAICPSCNDFSALVAAHVAAELKLPGHDSVATLETLHHKDKFRNFSKDLGLKTPIFYNCDHIAEAKKLSRIVKYPLIIKPVDLTGGKGISVARSKEELYDSVKLALNTSRANRVVVEEFINGTHHGFSSIIKNQKVDFYFIDNEYYQYSPFAVSTASSESSCSNFTIKKIIESCETIAKNLNLVDGILHLQFIETSDGEPVIIEICRRAPGDLYLELVRHSLDIPYSEWIIQGHAGKKIPDPKPKTEARCITRHCIIADKSGLFAGLKFSKNLNRSIIDQYMFVEKGELLHKNKSKVGIIFIKHANVEDRDTFIHHVDDMVNIQVV